ncbi:MAG: hypothetical protein CMJ45_08995 [Planctomyces sp.]|jgi:PAS domain S-box-containing protein|nr:hypothetical protein [Planctomyces sp.]
MTSGINLTISLESTADGVFTVDEKQRIVFWNQGAEDVLGYTSAEVIGRNCAEVIQGVDEDGQVVCTLECPDLGRAHLGTRLCGRNVRSRTKSGELRWLSVSHLSVNSDTGAPVLVHIFRNVTPEVEARKLLQRIVSQVTNYDPGQTGQVEYNQDGPYDTGLTERETQVLELLVKGGGTASIAEDLFISNTTARNHIQNILAKLGVHTRLEAVAYALKHRLIDPG